MQSQITCPQCQSPVVADVHQIIDVDAQPQFKQLLMGGQLNVAQCRNCGWQGQVTMPFVYHESAHDMLISFVPMELNMPYQEQERMMGQLVRRVVDSVPPEKRRAYLLQPKNMMRWQTFMEAVLATEGITPEMIARQREQGELMRTMISADNATVAQLITDRAELIDEQFIAMAQQALQTIQQAQQQDVLIHMSNVQAMLMRNTPAGKRVEQKQLAMHALNIDAKKAEGVSPQLLAKHVLLNQEDDEIVDMLVGATGALSYEFFSTFSSHIDDAAKAGEQGEVDRLTAIRTRLLSVYDEMRAANEKLLREAAQLVNQIAAAPDKMAAIQQNAPRIDEAFFLALEQQLEQARANADLERSVALKEIKTHLDQLMQQANPPEGQLIGALLQAPSPEAAQELLDTNPELVTPRLMEMFEQLSAELDAAPPDLQAQFKRIYALVKQRVAPA